MVAPVETVEETAGYAEYVRWCGRTGASRPPPTRLSVAYCPVPTSSFSRFCLALSAHFREGKSEPRLVGFPGLLSPHRPVEAGPRITAVTAVGRALRPWQVDRIQGEPITSDAADPQGGGWISPLWSTPMNSCLWFVSLICALVAIAACGPEAPGTAPASGTSDLPQKLRFAQPVF